MTELVGAQQDWMRGLPIQQQSVMLLACRGPDGLPKKHPSKALLRFYRSCVLNAAFYGRPITPEDDGDSFMHLNGINDGAFRLVAKAWLDSLDEMLVHPALHFIHGTEILGYKHPDQVLGSLWLGFYFQAAEALHLNPESEEQLDARLNDKNREFWSKA